MRALEARTPEAPHWDQNSYHHFLPLDEEARSVHLAAWVATEEAELVGFAAARLILDVCEVESVVVAERARRQGIGRALLETIMEWALNLGAHRVQLEVRNSNLPAIRLYEQAGLRSEGYRKAYYRDPVEDAVLMGLDFNLRSSSVENFL